MDHLMSYIFNVTTLCGKDNFVFWDDNINDFGICFQSFVLIFIPHALLAISCAYYLGNAPGRFYLRSSLQKGAIRIRALASISLAALQIIKTILLYDLNTNILSDKGISVIVECVVQVLSWLVLFAYLFILVERQCPSPRGRRPVLVAKLFVFVVDVIQQRSVLLLYTPDSLEHKIMFSCAIVHLLLIVTILFTLIPSSNNSQSHYIELLTNESEDERTSLLGTRRSNRVSYSGFREPMDPDYLGVAKSNTTWMSKLFLYWVNPLIMKGRRGKLTGTDEVFDLPPNGSASEVGEKFWTIFSSTRRLAGDKSFFKSL